MKNELYKKLASSYWDEQYKRDGYKVVHDAGTEEKTFDLAQREMNMFLNPSEDKINNLINDKENNPYPTYNLDYLKHPSVILKGKALDYGCGILGRYSIALSRYFESVIGVDISSIAVSGAKTQALKRQSFNSKFMLCDGMTIKLPDNSVDFIFSHLVLQHIGSLDAHFSLAKEFLRILKPNGMMRLEYLPGMHKKAVGFFSVVEGCGIDDDNLKSMYGDKIVSRSEDKDCLWITIVK